MRGVMILGGGLAGLGCASELPGCRVFEASPHPGGRAYSFQLGGVGFDQGAHISHSRDEGFIARTDHAAGAVVRTSRSTVRNFWSGRWGTYPIQNNLHELPLADRVQALTDLVVAHAQAPASTTPAHYRAWCLAQYGEYLTRHFYDVFTSKYWRVKSEDLATDWLAGRLLPSMLPRIIQGAFGPPEESQAVFAQFRYPAQGGFYRFFEALYSSIDLHLNERAVEIDVRRKRVEFASGRSEGYEQLVSTIPLPTLVGLIKDAPVEVRESAARLRATRLLCVNLIVNRPRITDAHWFYVYDPELEPSRVSIPSNLAPQSVVEGQSAIQGEVFRLPEEPLAVDALVNKSIADLGHLLGFHPNEVVQAGHVLVPQAYIVSDHHRAAAVECILTWLAQVEITSTGLYGKWKYVWSDQAFHQGQVVGQALRDRNPGRLAG
ncbi:MAG: FAD-dependent oxidoreductase [Gemmataceae bacterium]